MFGYGAYPHFLMLLKVFWANGRFNGIVLVFTTMSNFWAMIISEWVQMHWSADNISRRILGL